MFRLSVAVAVLSAALLPSARAAGDAPFPLLRALRDLRQGAQDLDVSPEQRVTIRGILRARKDDLLGATERAHVARKLVLEAETQDDVDAALIRERVQAAATAAADVAVLRAQVRHDVRAVLSQSQRSGADRLREGFMAALDRARNKARAWFEESI